MGAGAGDCALWIAAAVEVGAETEVVALLPWGAEPEVLQAQKESPRESVRSRFMGADHRVERPANPLPSAGATHLTRWARSA